MAAVMRIHQQACPHCGLVPVSAVERSQGNLIKIDYMCLNGHIWILKTLKPEVA